jgi:tetratricopeptide (TPR) repeat protein
VPDGPSRVVTKKGQVVSSANYVEGHIVGPCWYLGKDLNSPANRPPDVLGREKLAAQDFLGAESDFTRALAAEPSYENYAGRADARLGRGLFDPAIADYLAAMKAGGGRLQDQDLLKLKQAYTQQSARRKTQGDAAGAAAADLAVARLNLPALFTQASNLVRASDYAAAEAIYTRIIQIQPGAAGFSRRSDVRFELGDLDGTLADLNEAIRLSKPPPAFDFLKRAWLYRLKNDLPGAAAEFRTVAGAQPNNVNYRGEACHAACWLYLVECERGQNQAAAEELARTAAQVDRFGPTTGVWYRLEADLLLGRITEEQLMAKVAIPADQFGEANRFQALFFAGMLHQRAGDTTGALDRFRRALQTTYAHQFVPDVLEARRAVAAGK